MITSITYLIYLIGFLLAVQDEELVVINDTFMSIIGTGYYYMPLPEFPYRPYHPDSITEEISDDTIIINYSDYIDTTIVDNKKVYDDDLAKYNSFDWVEYHKKLKLYYERIRNPILDTANLIIKIYDTLVTVRRTGLLSKILDKDAFERNFDIDITWRYLAIKLVDSVKIARSFSINKITKTGKYNLVPTNYDLKHNDRNIGLFIFSRVVFNEKYNRACFYYSFHCGRLCGNGVLAFAEKINGKWAIVSLRELWSS